MNELIKFNKIEEEKIIEATRKQAKQEERDKLKQERIEFINRTIRMLNNVKSRVMDYKGKSPISYIDNKLKLLENKKQELENGSQ